MKIPVNYTPFVWDGVFSEVVAKPNGQPLKKGAILTHWQLRYL